RRWLMRRRRAQWFTDGRRLGDSTFEANQAAGLLHDPLQSIVLHAPLGKHLLASRYSVRVSSSLGELLFDPAGPFLSLQFKGAIAEPMGASIRLNAIV